MSGLEGNCLVSKVVSLGQPLPPEAQPGARLSLPQQGGTQGWDTWEVSRQGPRLDKEAEPRSLAGT